jgi:hypothetical protein
MTAERRTFASATTAPMGTEVLADLPLADAPSVEEPSEVGTQDRAELAPQIVRHPGGVLERQVQARDLAMAGQEDGLLAGDIAGEVGSKLADAGHAHRRVLRTGGYAPAARVSRVVYTSLAKRAAA